MRCAKQMNSYQLKEYSNLKRVGSKRVPWIWDQIYFILHALIGSTIFQEFAFNLISGFQTNKSLPCRPHQIILSCQ